MRHNLKEELKNIKTIDMENPEQRNFLNVCR